MTRKLPSFVSLFLILVLPLALALSSVRPIRAQARSAPGELLDSEWLPVGVQPVKVSASPSALAAPHTSPVMFIENTGQWDREVLFQVWGANSGPTWLAEDAIWLTIVQPALAHRDQGAPFGPTSAMAAPGALSRNAVAVKLSFIGSNPKPVVEPFGPIDTAVSYFLGNNPSNWHPNVPVWSGIRYLDLYPGMDLELVGEGGRMVQTLVARPGADLSAVEIHVEGVDVVRLDGDTLCLSTPAGEAVWPLLRLEGSSSEAIVQARGELAYEIATPYSRANDHRGLGTRTRLSDLNSVHLLYATFLGGTGYEAAYGLAVDPSGSAYVTGRAMSSDFPTTPGAFDIMIGGNWDAFIAKLNEPGTGLAYATFLGGSRMDDGYSIAVDASGAAYVTGRADSSDFPTTPGAFDTDSWATEAFVAKLNESGTALAYSTFLGGIGNDWGYGVSVDLNGAAYVTGNTSSPDFPTSTGAFDTSYNGGDHSSDAFIAKLNASGSALSYASFLGGTAQDVGDDIAVSVSGVAYVTGWTWSSDFPTTPDAFDTTHSGGYNDAFVVRLNELGTDLSYATFLGGSEIDEGHGIAVDMSGAAYVTGRADSSDFPTTPVAYDIVCNNIDAFIVKLNESGTDLAYATFLGGGYNDAAYDIAVDVTGAAYITGWTYASDFPTTQDAIDTTYNGDYDGFLAKLSATGGDLTYSTLLGGSGQDVAEGVAMDLSGAAYVTGETRSSTFPTTASAFDSTLDGGADAFVIKLSMGGGSGFLDLPVGYENFEVAASGSNDGTGPGRVNSWFDHKYPTYGVGDDFLWPYTGDPRPDPPDVRCSYGYNCYDGHDGTDFRHAVTGDEPVLAAAAGTVIEVVDGCQYEGSCGVWGNLVRIDHGNCYSTLYAHLEQVEDGIDLGVAVSSRQQIGIMGNTGYTMGETGTHLHFGLYNDPNCDGNWSDRVVADPYGWALVGADPWPANTTQPLWIHPLGQQASIGSDGGWLSTPSGTYAADIPPGALAETVTMELLATPPIAEPSAGLRSAGYSFWLRVFDWLLPDQAANSVAGGVSVDAFAEPISVTVSYGDADVIHLDENQLSVFRWDEGESSWLQLPSVIDTGANTAGALTTEPGSFSLQAPLMCTEDSSEPDDNYDSASAIPLDGTVVTRLFDTTQDEDWFRLPGYQGAIYTLGTGNVASNVDTALELYGLDGTTLLAADDNGGVGQSSYLEWQAPTDGIYFVRIAQADGSDSGCDAGYNLSVHVKHMIYLPLVIRQLR